MIMTARLYDYNKSWIDIKVFKTSSLLSLILTFYFCTFLYFGFRWMQKDSIFWQCSCDVAVQRMYVASPYTDKVIAPDSDPQPFDAGDGLIWVVGPVLAVVFIICIVIAILLYKKWVAELHERQMSSFQPQWWLIALVAPSKCQSSFDSQRGWDWL